ncbi:hypothetical protein EON81_07450 [bacterium]|nr:MAG: hypothetical protein EON81_07450 [bacterium]
MRNQAIIAAAIAAALTGCGGAGSGSSTSSTGTTATTATTSTATTASTSTATTSGPTGAVVRLKSTPGQIELAFLTGQARSPLAANDVDAQVGRITFTDSNGQSILGLDPVSPLGLNTYSRSTYRINATVLPANVRLLNQLELQFDSITQTDADGVKLAPITRIDNTPILLGLDARLYPNRYTSIPVFLNDAQFPVTESTDPAVPNFAVFDRDQFEVDNGIGEGRRQRVPSFLSDYLRFDISGVPAADRPLASDGQPVDYILFSGDNYAVAANRPSTVGSGLLFESVNLNRFNPDLPTEALIPGIWKDREVVLEPGGVRNSVPGTYDLRQPNPVFDPRVAFITSVQGLFKDFGDMFDGITAVQGVSFPNIRDESRQDIVVVSSTTDGATYTVNAMYYGYLNLEDLSVHFFPLRNLTTASAEGEIVGTITDTRDINGVATRTNSSIRYGNWNASLPGIPATSGSFSVYRR